jgi:hypothetical protein
MDATTSSEPDEIVDADGDHTPDHTGHVPPAADTAPNDDGNDVEDEDEQLDAEDLVDLDDTLVLLCASTSEDSQPPLNSLVYDILFRSSALEDVCAWDQFALYEKVRQKKGKGVACESSDSEGDDDDTGLFLHRIL